MSWFKRLKEGIQTTTKNKKEAPDGLWHKCTQCATMTTVKELKDNLYPVSYTHLDVYKRQPDVF